MPDIRTPRELTITLIELNRFTKQMPPKEWTHYLPDGFTLRVGRQTVRGKMTGFSVALVHEGECIVRYDTAHGFAHIDILGRKSV